MTDTISISQLKEFKKQFLATPQNLLMQNAVTETTVEKVALNREVINNTQHVFSNQVDDWQVTNQKQSGRCWCFAGLNLYRPIAIEKLGVKDFEFSQCFTLFYDRIEKSNFFLSKIIATADLPLEDRLVANLLSSPVSEGGWWVNYINIVNKYGVVPKEVMPETESSSNSRLMNANLTRLLRQRAKPLRELTQKTKSVKDIEKFKLSIMNDVYRLVSIHLGTPPERFSWKAKIKDGDMIEENKITPIDFFNKYVGDNMGDYITLMNDPREKRPYDKIYGCEWFNTVIEGRQLLFLNVSIKDMKKAVKAMLDDNTPLWMSAQAGRYFYNKLGIMDNDIFQYEEVYHHDLPMNKADRLDYHDGGGNHAMVFTGYDEIKGKITRWRIENSWGDDKGDKGFYVMNDNWFDDNVYTAVVHKKYLSKIHQKAIKAKPEMLMPWELPY